MALSVNIHCAGHVPPILHLPCPIPYRDIVPPACAAGTTPALSSSCRENRGLQHPAALLKVCQPYTSSSRSIAASGKKHRVPGGMHGGGSTQVWFLDDVGKIEQTLLEAGKEDTTPPGNMPDDCTAVRPPHLPHVQQQPIVRSWGGCDDDLITDQQRDDCRNSPKEVRARRSAGKEGGFSPQVRVFGGELTRKGGVTRSRCC